jgi:hypothetical protein
MTEFKHKDLGVINFGTTYKGKRWSDVPVDWLEYVAGPDCRTTEENKEIARQELAQRKIVDGQLEMEFK